MATSKLYFAAAFLAATVPALAQNQLQTLQKQLVKAQGNAVATAAIKARIAQLENSQMQVAAPSTSTGGPQFIVAPNYNTTGPCGSSASGTAGTTATASNAPALAITDFANTTDSLSIGGLGSQIFDVDLTVAITHTWNSDLVITLTSPSGTNVDVSSNNGGSADDVFNGTLFDDEAASSVVGYPYVSGVVVPTLKPEQSLNNTLRGENPNGTWTLNIYDGAGGDIGVLNSWSLSVTDGTVTSVPPTYGPLTTFSTGPISVPINDLTVNTSTLTVAGGPTSIAQVQVYVELQHTWNSDLDISIQSPIGTTVLLSDNRGGSNDDVFNGTLFRMDSPNPIASYVFTNLVVAPDLRPDGDLTAFAGEDSNGTWTLIVDDQAGGDIGTINRWDVKVGACGNTVVNYCTAGTTTNGCNATMTSTGTPSISGASFTLTATNVEGQKTGLIFYGITGRNNVSWGGGSTSFLCVKAPTQRTNAQNSGGTLNGCDGTVSLNFFAYMAGNGGALGQPIAAGQVYDAQCWFRDPPAPKTTSLSDGIEFTLAP